MAEKLGVSNVKDMVVAGLKSYEALSEAKKNDGKIDLKDAGLLFPLLPYYMAAINDINQVIPELKDLSVEESAELVSLVAADLGKQVSPELANKIEKVLLALKADYEAVKAFL